MADSWIYIVALLTIPIVYIASSLWKTIQYLQRVRKITKALSQFTTEEYHWLLGHLNLFPGPGLNEAAILKMSEMVNKSKLGAAALMFPFVSSLLINEPEIIKLVTNANPPKGLLPGTQTGYKFLTPWIGDGLLTSSGNKWFRNRKLLTSAFHFDILKSYLNIYNECGRVLIHKIQAQSQKGHSIEVSELISLYTLEIILKCAFSSKEDIQMKGNTSDFVQTVKRLSRLFIMRIFEPLHFIDWMYRLSSDGKIFYKLSEKAHEMADTVIEKRRKILEINDEKAEKKDRGVDFLDILLLAKDDSGKGLSKIEIRDEVSTFLFAGHDTTSSALVWILYNLARHHKYQDKARKEVDEILKSGDEVKWEHLGQFNYLVRCIKESLRLHPPVPSVSREFDKPLVIAGHELPSGTVADVGAYNVHHNPKIWGENHMEYIPDRFLPENMAKMHSHAFIPFSAGSRNCIGQVFAMNELKSTIAKILKRFEISVDTSHEVKMSSESVLRSSTGIKLFFKERQN